MMKLSKRKPQLIALEERILFDGAAGATVDAIDKGGKVSDKSTGKPVDASGKNNSSNNQNNNQPAPVEPSPQPQPEPEPKPEPSNENNSDTPTNNAGGAGKSDEEKNDENVSGDLGNQGNNPDKEDTKGNAGGDNQNGNDDSEDDGDDEEEPPPPPPPEPPGPGDDNDDNEDDQDENEDDDDDDEEEPPPPPPPPPPPNEPPDAVDDTVSTNYDTPLDINVVSNDSDPDSSFSITSFTQPDYGTIEMIDGVLRYTPPAGFSGVTTFTYTITDEFGLTDTATVTITVGDAPPPPPPPPPPEPPPEPPEDPEPPAPEPPPVTPDPPKPIDEPKNPEPEKPAPILPIVPGITTQATALMQQIPVTVTVFAQNQPLNFQVPNFSALFETKTFPTIQVSDRIELPQLENSLFIQKPLESVSTSEDRRVDYVVPPDTFGHTDSGEKIDVRASVSDGSELPATLTWDKTSGRLTGTLPPGVNQLEIKIEATDTKGQKAEVKFTIRAGDIKEKISMKGKPSLTQQLVKAIQKFRLT